MQMTAKFERLNWIDSLKGIAILLVVLGHTLDGTPMYSTTDWMKQVHGFIYSFHMPLFFFLSGCTFNLSKKHSDYKAFAFRILELFLVYVIWSFFMYAGKALLSAEVSNQNKFSFPYCLLFSPVDPFWYLIVLLFYSLVGFLIERANDKVRICIFCMAFILGALISLWESKAIKDASEFRYLYRILYHFVFFVGGICFIKKDCLKLASKTKATVMSVLVVVFLSLKMFFRPTDIVLFNEITAWSCVLWLVALFSQFAFASCNSLISFFGRNSLYIYCLHNFCTVLCRILLRDKINNGGGYVCIVFLITMTICTVAVLIIQRMKAVDIFFKPIKTTMWGFRKSKKRI